MKTYNVILKPVVTEKSAIDQTHGVYTFVVNRDSTKIDIKNSIEKIFGKKVKAVRTSILQGKIRLIGRGRIMTKRPMKKIAKVTLANKETMDPNKVSENKAVSKVTKTIKKTNK